MEEINELEIMKQIKSPFLVPAICAFQDIVNYYIVMPYVPYGTLENAIKQKIAKKERWTEEEIKSVMTMLIMAIQDFHKIGYIHRDVKPANILFEENGVLRLMDYGVSTLNTYSNAYQMAGTALYMAPEIAGFGSYGFEADYYSIGVIAHQMAFNRFPNASGWENESKMKARAHRSQ